MKSIKKRTDLKNQELYSEGKIGNKSYIKTSKLIEKNIESLKQAIKNPFISPNYFSSTNLNPASYLLKRPDNPSTTDNPSRGELRLVFFCNGNCSDCSRLFWNSKCIPIQWFLLRQILYGYTRNGGWNIYGLNSVGFFLYWNKDQNSKHRFLVCELVDLNWR